MTIWAIVPVKPLRRGKSRLSSVLSEDERENLNRLFLETTLTVLKGTKEISQTLVVSRDPAALAIARAHDARTLLEDGGQELNLALERAAAVALIYSAKGIIILPADIPLATSEDIAQVLALPEKSPSVSIVPDRREDGTNALLLIPPMAIPFHYGVASFKKHCALAIEKNIELNILRSPSLGLDLDLPEDLELYRQLTNIEIFKSTYEETHDDKQH